jgi:hypothetical protein
MRPGTSLTLGYGDTVLVDEGLDTTTPEGEFLEKYSKQVSAPLEGDTYTVHNISYLSKRARPLWFICTDYPFTNKSPEYNYVTMDFDTKKLAKNLVSAVNQRAEETKLLRLIQRFLTFARYRLANGFLSTIVLYPPPLSKIAKWEVAFGKVGIRIAWVDENGEAHESTRHTAPIVTKGKSKNNITIENDTNRGYIDTALRLMEPGTTITFPLAPTLLTQELRRREGNAVYWICSKVERALGDRKFKVDISKKNVFRMNIYRYTDEEYFAWLARKKMIQALKEPAQS